MILANHNNIYHTQHILGEKQKKTTEKEFIWLVSFMSVTFVAFVPEGMKEGVSCIRSCLNNDNAEWGKADKEYILYDFNHIQLKTLTYIRSHESVFEEEGGVSD